MLEPGPDQEPRLVEDADRIRFANLRDGDDVDPLVRIQQPQSVLDCALPVAEVRSDADVGRRHVAMLSRLKRFGVAFGGLVAVLAWSGPAAAATLTQVERDELRAYP